jgi:phosphoadenosine phosphosulfate reductase
MSGLEDLVFGDAATATRVGQRLAALETPKFLRFVIEDMFAGRVALVSSFGADAAVLLHMTAQIDKDLPVLFLDTLHLFPETLAYRDRLVDICGLTNAQNIVPDAQRLSGEDPENFLWAQDPDRCCAIRKVEPLAKTLSPYDAWISGRKRFQSRDRAALPLLEADGERVKVNALANWTAAEIDRYFGEHNLPRHQLVAKGYLSIGCVPCTTPVRPGEAARAGRWRGHGKTECGIHVAAAETAAGN